jgi:hypothetical protein
MIPLLYQLSYSAIGRIRDVERASRLVKPVGSARYWGLDSGVEPALDRARAWVPGVAREACPW